MPLVDLGSSSFGIEGSLDGLVNTYVFDHKPATLEIDVVDIETRLDGLDDPIVVLTAESLAIKHTQNTGVSVTISDLSARLDVAAQTVQLQGTGNDEGTSANKGQYAPLVLGAKKNFEGLRISAQDQIYLLHRDSQGNALRSVDAVYVGQNLVDPEDYDVTLGESNLVTINTDILDGVKVTFDATGPVEAGDTVSEFFTYLAATIGPLTTAELNTDRIAKFALSVPFAAAWYLSDDVTISDTFDRLTSAYAWWGADNNGLLDIGRNTSPGDDFVDYELPANMILEAEVLAPVPPARVVTTGFDHNPTPMTEDEIVGAAKGTERALWAQTPYTKISTDNNQYVSIYPSARTPEDFVTPFLNEADALLVHNWMVETYSAQLRFYRVKVHTIGIRFQIGRVIEFGYPRWSMDDVTRYRIAQVTIGNDRTVELIVWLNGPRYVVGGDDETEYLLTYEGAPIAI